MPDFYADVATIYDRMIRWERRLAFETPLFEALWARTGARRVLDAACGSGRHLALFQNQGRIVTGADASPEMLALAREQVLKIPEPERPRLIQSAWAELPQKISETFDAVLCLGNSLPYVTDVEARRASLAGLWSRVAPGGFLLIQFRNFARMRARGERFLPLSQAVDREAGMEYVCLRQYEWRERTVDFNVMILSREFSPAQHAGCTPPAESLWTLRHWTTPLAILAAAEIAGDLQALGATVQICGSLALEPYHEPDSEDVVLFAEQA